MHYRPRNDETIFKSQILKHSSPIDDHRDLLSEKKCLDNFYRCNLCQLKVRIILHKNFIVTVLEVDRKS